jgi:hypothetical protein
VCEEVRDEPEGGAEGYPHGTQVPEELLDTPGEEVVPRRDVDGAIGHGGAPQDHAHDEGLGAAQEASVRPIARADLDEFGRGGDQVCGGSSDVLIRALNIAGTMSIFFQAISMRISVQVSISQLIKTVVQSGIAIV